MNVTDKSCTGGVHVRLETGLDTLDVHPGLDTAVAVHPLDTTVQPERHPLEPLLSQLETVYLLTSSQMASTSRIITLNKSVDEPSTL